MSPLQYSSSISAALSKAEEEVKTILFAAARHLSDEGKALEVELENEVKASIDGLKGAIKIAGAPYQNLLHLLGLVKAVGSKVNEGPAKAVEEVKAVEAEAVKAIEAPITEAVKVESEVHDEIVKVSDTLALMKEDLQTEGR